MTTINEYQERALLTAIYPKDRALEYTTLGLTSEAGEVAGKVKKAIRDDGGALTFDRRDDLIDELGDVLWYCATLADALHVDLESVALRNLRKLASRQERGKLTGDGDTR